jgi:hypothetical protein
MKISRIIYVFLLLFSLFFFSCESNDGIVIHSSSDIKATNKALVELFTNTSCVPCVPANIFLDGIARLNGMTNNDTNVIIIRYHSTLFPNDPYYNFNPTDNFARQQFYNAGISNPRGYLMGTSMGGFNSTNWTNSINTRLAISNSFGINFTITYDSVSRNGTLNIQIGQLNGTAQTNLVMHIVVIENYLILDPPAPNGETEFDNTLRDLLTAPDGEPLNITPGQTQNFISDFTLLNGIDQHNTDIIIFVQNTATKEVFGVLKKKLM